MAAEAEGNDDAAALIAAGEAILERAPGLRVDYLVVVDPATLDPVARVVPGARALVAAEIAGCA
jgi:pantothenate synthetase